MTDAPKLSPGLHALRIGILAYFAVLFALAIWAAWAFLNGVVQAETCPEGACARGAAVVSDWISAIGPVELALAGATFTGVVVLGLALFALPWWGYLVWLKRTGRYPTA